MKLFLEVEIDNIKNLEDVAELLNVGFEEEYESGITWTASQLYDETDDSVPEIKGFNIYTELKRRIK